MAPRAAILVLVLGLGPWACGGSTNVTNPDGGDAGPPRDATVDRGADDGPDGPLPDGGQDAGPATAPRFLSQTSGGARLLSTNYRLELFVGPASPPAATGSSAYRLQLGPGALRNAR